MYGLPNNFPYDVFIKKSLRVVSYAEYSLYLIFDGNCTISVEGEISIDDFSPITAATHPANILNALGRTVSSAFQESEGTLCIQFENGHRVRIYDTFKNYESYSISVDGNRTIV